MKATLSSLLLLFSAIQFSNAQDWIIPKQGDPFKAYNVTNADGCYFYQKFSESEHYYRISKDEVMMIKYENGKPNEPGKTEEVKSESKAKPVLLNLEGYKGLLIARGNNVYVPVDSRLDFEAVGQKYFKEYIVNTGFWNVVENPEEAHFILEYGFCDRGNDTNYILLRHRDAYLAEPEMYLGRNALVLQALGWASSSEDNATNINNVERLIPRVRDLIEKIENDKLPKAIRVEWTM